MDRPKLTDLYNTILGTRTVKGLNEVLISPARSAAEDLYEKLIKSEREFRGYLEERLVPETIEGVKTGYNSSMELMEKSGRAISDYTKGVLYKELVPSDLKKRIKRDFPHSDKPWVYAIPKLFIGGAALVGYILLDQSSVLELNVVNPSSGFLSTLLSDFSEFYLYSKEFFSNGLSLLGAYSLVDSLFNLGGGGELKKAFIDHIISKRKEANNRASNQFGKLVKYDPSKEVLIIDKNKLDEIIRDLNNAFEKYRTDSKECLREFRRENPPVATFLVEIIGAGIEAVVGWAKSKYPSPNEG